MINIFGVAKNSGAAVFHLASGNPVAAGASVVKAGVSCIPVVGHVPGVGKLVDAAITGDSQQLTEAEYRGLDYDNDGDIDFNDASEMIHEHLHDDLNDLSDMFHHVADFFSS